MTHRSRRRFLAGIATVGTASVPGIATGTSTDRQRRRVESPVAQDVESDLEYFEETIERYTERLARSFVNPEGEARLTYITDGASVDRIRAQIRHLADAYVRVFERGTSISQLHCLAQYGEIGQQFRHRAEYQIRYNWARDYAYDNITRQQYHRYIYNTMELF